MLRIKKKHRILVNGSGHMHFKKKIKTNTQINKYLNKMTKQKKRCTRSTI